MTAVPWRSLRLLAGLAVLAVVVRQTGTGPFVDGFRSLDLQTLVLGALVAIPTTAAGAWRWHLVARGLGIGVRPLPAVAWCYRSQFLNTVLPAGVVGDVHRGIRHGRASGHTGLGLRSVAWERLAGQVVQVAITLVVLLLLPSPVRSSVPVLLGVLAAALLCAVAVRDVVPAGWASPVARVLRAARADVRRGLLSAAIWPGVVLASTVAVVGHVTTYAIAARAVGVEVSLRTLLPLALLVLVAMAIPLNLAGWGPREGVAAWAFAAAGLGAGQGVATAVAYGVIVAFASLPGAVVLVVAARRREVARPAVPSPRPLPRLVGQGAGRG